ncbi:MAG TPA: methylated-DNA--[protein]-cysteine S-methyltransferase [Candidatus Hydrogenedentes bacterium]|nr:methylated-DNA--[protein]-cysteine S-methyltransferase [Candidatus Hydrogenedentota bacterium]HIJ74761.1 methylated-DNA--[protein]-cysteine S-methyltransferase [Candidatus Hydrogenedentota bacterium]
MLESANFRYHHARGAIYGRFTERGLRNLILPVGASKEKVAYLLHSAANVVWAEPLHSALARYFSGRPETFAGIPLDLEAGTAFQRQVWETARRIPWGATTTYGELACLMGRARGSARAVGQALGANPVSILVPCHRILASGGGLGGFSCGLDWKRELLRLEGYRF